jgi:thiol-disulfide isomerase/thioredoxin
MRYILFISIVLLSCKAPAKLSYTTMYNDKNEKVLQGTINREVIEKDTAFNWFSTNYNYAQPAKSAVTAFASTKNNFKMIVFGGTWCEDTQNLLPMFYKLVAASKYPEKRITLVGVDRQKQSGNELSAKYNIKNVPCFIVLKNDGTEVGRVVEYGKGNGIDVELGEIVSSLSK